MSVRKLNHPKWTWKNDKNNQSRILPGTETTSRIRISSNLVEPTENKEDLNSWLIDGLPEDMNIKTVYDLFQNSVKKYGDLPCLGDRRHGGDDFHFRTFKEVSELADKIGSAFIQKLGVKADNSYNVGIFAGNCWEWTTNGIAACNYNYVMVPMYDTLGDQAMRYIVKQCEFETVLVDTEARVQKFIDSVQAHAEGTKIVKYLVSFVRCADAVIEAGKAAGVEVVYQQDLIDGVTEIEQHNPPQKDSIYSICYTSGTTGNPKGVVQTHGSWLADMTAAFLVIRMVTTDDVWLSYLPSAHVFERMIQTMMLFGGGRIGYFGGDPKNLIADAGALKPTIFGGVPRVWNKIYAKIESAQRESWVKNKLIGWALRNKLALVNKGITGNKTIYDKIVFGKIQALLGGRVDVAVCGAAPIKNSVMNTLRAAMGCYITEAYGQTECNAAATATMTNDPLSSVGAPVCGVAIKLVSLPEMNYHAENDQGEICFKGPILMKEYYKNAEKTAETIDEDGWLHTGDVGQWTEYGTLQIIDRAKHIFKTSLGEYIAPEKIENIYALHEAVGQCFVYGDSLKNVLVGVVVPCPDNFLNWAKAKDMEVAMKDDNIKDRLLKEMTNLGKKSGLKGFENVKCIQFHNELMSVENGLLTPTMKTKRPQCKKYFQQQIDEMYSQLGE